MKRLYRLWLRLTLDQSDERDYLMYEGPKPWEFRSEASYNEASARYLARLRRYEFAFGPLNPPTP